MSTWCRLITAGPSSLLIAPPVLILLLVHFHSATDWPKKCLVTGCNKQYAWCSEVFRSKSSGYPTGAHQNTSLINQGEKVVLNKSISITLVTLLVVLSGTAVFANNSSNPEVRTDTANVPSGAPAEKEVKPNEQLKSSVLKLVSDAKAGNVAMAPKSQFQPAKSNNWSKGTKIAVGVGIAAAVIVTILIVSPAFNDGQ